MDAWDDDVELQRSLDRSRDRRRRMAQLMVLILVVPIGAQLVFVSTGVAVHYGVMAVALPAIVLWILWRGRGGDDGGAGDPTRR